MTGARLVLVGAPAAGKTTVGRLVAERLGWAFTDTDAELEAALGLSLPEAYAGLDPAELAAVEARVCLACLDSPGVVALGSGALAHPGVADSLDRGGVVWLGVSAAQASRRLGMAVLGMETLVALRSQMDRLLRDREHWYEGVATIRIDTDRLSAAEAAEAVIAAWKGE